MLVKGATLRALTAKIIHQTIQTPTALEKILQTHLKTIQPRDQSTLYNLCYETLRWYPQLELIVNHLLKKPEKLTDREVACLIMIGVVQIEKTNIPVYATIHATVDACRVLNKAWACPIVNGCLRHFSRNKEKIIKQLSDNLTYQYAMPAWLIQTLKENWQEKHKWKSILIGLNQRAPMTLRINLCLNSRESYITKLEQQSILYRIVPELPAAIILQDPIPSNDLPGFHDGLISIQDAGGQLAATILPITSKSRILDACAAPGNKTAAICEQVPTAKIVALEKKQERLKTMQKNFKRLQHKNIVVKQGDALKPDQWWNGEKFDHVLVDAPCSATGVIARHPEIKLRRTLENIQKNADIQIKLLTTLWDLLKKDGYLLYVTCSLLQEENDVVVEKFLQNTKDATVMQLNKIAWSHTTKYGKQILPGDSSADGFYYALLYKK